MIIASRIWGFALTLVGLDNSPASIPELGVLIPSRREKYCLQKGQTLNRYYLKTLRFVGRLFSFFRIPYNMRFKSHRMNELI